MKYRKKPVIIDAWKFDVEFVSLKNAREFCKKNDLPIWGTGGMGGKPGMIIPTLEGNHLAEVGDWIVRGVKGEYYPVKPDIFEMTYEPVEDK